MKTRSATSTARRTLLRKGRDLLRSVAKKGRSKKVDVMELLSESQRQELACIHLALERIERGIFGACQDCSERIAEERLSETPWELTCAECATDLLEAVNKDSQDSSMMHYQ